MNLKMENYYNLGANELIKSSLCEMALHGK